MLLKRFYDAKLAQASYLVGCSATGQALVVDPNRDVQQYIAAAATEGVRITHVAETHIHADFLSGSRALAAQTGAALLLSAEGGPDWQYAFAKDAGATLLSDGNRFDVGNVRVDVLHTPGHTPEHISFMVTDRAATDRPMGVFTGDFVFVGDVGRPDLLERAANVVGTMEASARTLYASLQRFKALPDYLQVWPGHGAGSACGKSLGAVPQSTLGYERAVNWAFGAASEADFVEAVLSGQPEPPGYFSEMKRINRDDQRTVRAAGRPPVMRPAELSKVLVGSARVVDTRPADAFAAGHVPGTLNIPLNRSFTTWAGSLLSYDADFYLLVSDDRALDEAVHDLAMIGLDRVAGWWTPDAISDWAAAGRALETTPQIQPAELEARLRAGEIDVIDVRGQSEWDTGHIPGVANIPLGALASRLAEIPGDRPVVLQCQGGGRSAIAASLLQANGIGQVLNLSGGFGAWKRAGLPVEREGAEVVS